MEKSFIQLSKQWYAKENLLNSNYVDEILVCIEYPLLNDSGEFALRWYDMKDNQKPALKLEVFEDSFQAFLDSGLTFHMGMLNRLNPQPEAIKRALLQLGFKETIAEKPIQKPHPDLPLLLKFMRALSNKDLLTKKLMLTFEKAFDIDVFKIALDENIKWYENKQASFESRLKKTVFVIKENTDSDGTFYDLYYKDEKVAWTEGEEILANSEVNYNLVKSKVGDQFTVSVGY